MKKCGKPVKAARNGVDRGKCTNLAGHTGVHSSNTCRLCGIVLTAENLYPSWRGRNGGSCISCARAYSDEQWRQKTPLGFLIRTVRIPGEIYTLSCGCSGIWPSLGTSNLFVVTSRNKRWTCRIAKILNSSKVSAIKHQYVPIDSKTPHSVIRQMMGK